MSDRPMHVEVTGLRDVQAALARVDREAPDMLKRVFKDIAANTVAEATSRVPRVTGAAARSYRARGTRRGASVAMGGPKAPYTPWLDWGGSTKVDPNEGPQGRVYRPFVAKGRYLYPHLVENLDHIQERTAAAIDDVLRRYGMVVDG